MSNRSYGTEWPDETERIAHKLGVEEDDVYDEIDKAAKDIVKTERPDDGSSNFATPVELIVPRLPCFVVPGGFCDLGEGFEHRYYPPAIKQRELLIEAESQVSDRVEGRSVFENVQRALEDAEREYEWPKIRRRLETLEASAWATFKLKCIVCSEPLAFRGRFDGEGRPNDGCCEQIAGRETAIVLPCNHVVGRQCLNGGLPLGRRTPRDCPIPSCHARLQYACGDQYPDLPAPGTKQELKNFPRFDGTTRALAERQLKQKCKKCHWVGSRLDRTAAQCIMRIARQGGNLTLVHRIIELLLYRLLKRKDTAKSLSTNAGLETKIQQVVRGDLGWNDEREDRELFAVDIAGLGEFNNLGFLFERLKDERSTWAVPTCLENSKFILTPEETFARWGLSCTDEYVQQWVPS